MVRDPCYCREAPRDPATGQPRFRCNWCWNGLLDGKNSLVRENHQLQAELRQARAEAGRLEGELAEAWREARELEED
jgi:hypothetical protein